MRGFTDIHSHFVYGVDDGARSREIMEAMLDAAYADGITSLFATSHITPGVKAFDGNSYIQHLREARAYCEQKEYGMRLFSGAEILYTPAMRRYAQEGRLPTLGSTNRVLIEFSPDIEVQEIENAIEMVLQGGYVPILAHIERYSCMLRHKNAYKIKQNYDVEFQINASTVIEKQGFLREHEIWGWFEKYLIDYVACDAHDVKHRKFRMHEAYRELKRRLGKEDAKLLTGFGFSISQWV